MSNDHRVKNYSLESSIWFNDSLFLVDLKCGWASQHIIRCLFKIEDKKLTKIGQDPSLADIAGAALSRQFKKILGHERAHELSKAIGLMAHGVGIGSFVYLRRVFEGILEDHRRASEEAGKPIAKYQSMKMEDKIQALAGSLPRFLVENRLMYGILSKAVHELDEDTCKKYFPAVQKAIFMILKQDAEAKAARDEEAALAKELAAIHQEIKTTTSEDEPS